MNIYNSHNTGWVNQIHGQNRKVSFGFIPRRFVVSETEHAVLIRNGAVDRVLSTGVHSLTPRTHEVRRYLKTPQIVIIPGQEMLTADGAGVRATVSATVRVVDPVAVIRNGGWRDQFHLMVQLALRNAVAALGLEELLAARAQLDTDLNLAVANSAEGLGIEVEFVAVRDFIVPGELKHAVAEMVTARLAGQATLERARAETAALRSLANAAKAASDNPALLQLRLIQQMEHSQGNTYVLGSALTVGSQ